MVTYILSNKVMQLPFSYQIVRPFRPHIIKGICCSKTGCRPIYYVGLNLCLTFPWAFDLKQLCLAFFYTISQLYCELKHVGNKCWFPLSQEKIIHCLDLQMNFTWYKFNNW